MPGTWALIAVLLAACGDGGSSSGPEPKPVSYAPFAGTWRGSLAEATSGSFGETELTLQQSGGTLSGTWTASFNSGTVNGGTISGSVAGNSETADFRLTSSWSAQCPIVVTVSLQSTEAQGIYASVDCPVLMTGTVHVYKDGTGGPTYVPPLPAAPTGVAATAGNGQVTVRWSRVAQASSHNLYWSSSSGFNPTTWTKVLRVSEPATVPVPDPGTTYYFVIAGENLTGEGPPSAEVNAMANVLVTDPPSGVMASAADGQATVSWQDVSGAAGYNLYWSASPGQALSAGTKVTGVTSPYVLAGLTNGTTYFIALTATNAAGESGPSVEARVTPYSTLEYNFDDGTLQGWTPSGAWGVVAGTVGSGAYHSASYSATDSPYGEYLNYTDASLTSPPIDLSGSASPVLTFWHRYVLEAGYDYGRVEISTDGGASWTTLRSYTGTEVSWPAVTISLQGYSAPAVRIRFRLTTDYSITADGWYIDDIAISR